MKRITSALTALLLCLAATACGPSLSTQENESAGFPSASVSSAQENSNADADAADSRSAASDDGASNDTASETGTLPEGAITDESGDFVYTGKLQQIGDDEHGYIQVPLGYVPFQDEDVEGLVQYSDVTGKNIFTLTHYEGTDYQTAANNLYSYMASQEDIEGLSGAQVSPNGYTSLQLYGHYTDGYFVVTWLIEDPADTSSSYYLCLEFDSEHQYMMACSSTFQTAEDYHSTNN